MCSSLPLWAGLLLLLLERPAQLNAAQESTKADALLQQAGIERCDTCCTC